MEIFRGIGLMSGTSLDGLDICLSEYNFTKPGFKILIAETIPYNSTLKQKLKNSVLLSGEELIKLDVEFGRFLGNCVSDFIEKHNLSDIDFIASHGHTVFHNPKEGYTLQIGNGTQIFKKTGICTVYDFRTADVIFGGQGAPLVPIGDEMLFSEFDACLNLGGFSNISFNRNGQRTAFDICPVNIVLNRLTEKLGIVYDKDGEIAASSKVSTDLLSQLNKLEFYRKNPPKSLGVEWCNQNIFPLLQDSELSVQELIATFTQHIADQISEILNKYSVKNVLISGGGAYNKFLIKTLGAQTCAALIIPEKNIIEYKESLIFGWMGLLRLKNKNNILNSVTGAERNHSAGIIVGEFVNLRDEEEVGFG